jgi:hypothetical protein
MIIQLEFGKEKMMIMYAGRSLKVINQLFGMSKYFLID